MSRRAFGRWAVGPACLCRFTAALGQTEGVTLEIAARLVNARFVAAAHVAELVDAIDAQHQHAALAVPPRAGVARWLSSVGFAAAQHARLAGAGDPNMAAITCHMQAHAVEGVVVALVGAAEALTHGSRRVSGGLNRPPQASRGRHAGQRRDQHRPSRPRAEPCSTAPVEHDGDEDAPRDDVA